MNDDDLIRRGDVRAALATLDVFGQFESGERIGKAASVITAAVSALDALPAAAPRPMGEAPRDGTDFLSVAENMADAIEQAMPRIRNMWESFPYAELDGDDECMYRLRRSAEALRNFQLSMQYAHPAAPEDTP
jgi:hypothetical protein